MAPEPMSLSVVKNALEAIAQDARSENLTGKSNSFFGVVIPGG